LLQVRRKRMVSTSLTVFRWSEPVGRSIRVRLRPKPRNSRVRLATLVPHADHLGSTNYKSAYPSEGRAGSRRRRQRPACSAELRRMSSAMGRYKTLFRLSRGSPSALRPCMTLRRSIALARPSSTFRTANLFAMIFFQDGGAQGIPDRTHS
jgi:hypothetical protein